MGLNQKLKNQKLKYLKYKMKYTKTNDEFFGAMKGKQREREIERKGNRENPAVNQTRDRRPQPRHHVVPLPDARGLEHVDGPVIRRDREEARDGWGGITAAITIWFSGLLIDHYAVDVKQSQAGPHVRLTGVEASGLLHPGHNGEDGPDEGGLFLLAAATASIVAVPRAKEELDGGLYPIVVDGGSGGRFMVD